jgi:hypothetical protein
MKSCLDEIRELYAKYSSKEIADAIATYRKDQEELKELTELELQKEQIDDKLVKFQRIKN